MYNSQSVNTLCSNSGCERSFVELCDTVIVDWSSRQREEESQVKLKISSYYLLPIFLGGLKQNGWFIFYERVHCNKAYRKIPKISPSMYKPLQI